MRKKVSLIIPTYNEEKNIGGLIGDIADVAEKNGLDMEVIVVDDDSKDGTALVAKEGFARYGNIKGNVIVRKFKKRSLSLSVVEGIQSAAGDIIGVMDADFSHPPSMIPALIRAISGDIDMAIGSRYIKGGGVAGWPLKRKISSRIACALARPIAPVKDVTSGFFFFKRGVVKDAALLNPIGFKIGLEVIVKGDYKKIVEVPYVFTERRTGSSKFGLKEAISYIRHLAALYRYVLGNGIKKICIYR